MTDAAALPGLAALLDRYAEDAADPARARALAAEVLDAAAPRLPPIWPVHADTAVRAATTLCGAAPFLAPHLRRHPDWLPRLVTDALEEERGAAAFQARLAPLLDQATDHAAALRHFKYYELARITLRDLWAAPDDIATTEAVLAELSHLADALLDAALQRALDVVAAAAGPARWTGADGAVIAPRFTVLGMGKLGGEELNFSSDVDLIYVLESTPADTIAGPLAPAEYYGRVVRELGRLVTATTGDGFLYRVDLDLRPEGQSGPLVVPSDMLTEYYDVWAATWEKAAFMKARPVAGDRRFGWRVIRGLDPMIYRSAMDYAGVAAIRAMKDRVEQESGRAGGAFNVKIGAGGIRDVEFVAQALQLLHGGRIPDVRDRSTQRALTALAQVGVLPHAVVTDLRRAYAFLRRTENRLQMVGERQTHRLPEDALAVAALARALGIAGADPAAAFRAELDAHRTAVRAAFAPLFADEGVQPLLDLFQRNVPQLLTQPGLGPQIERLAVRFAHAIDASPNRERAMNNLDRFIRGVGSRGFYYGLLVDRPELVDRLAALFAASEYLSGYLATHPRLIEPIFSDPNVLVLSRDELRAGLTQLRAGVGTERGGDEPERTLAALRLLHNRELVNIGLLDLAEKIAIEEAETGLTELAEVCVEGALDLAHRELERRGAPPVSATNDFLVVGMGKLASRELTYGSDLDVIFLYDASGADDAEVLVVQEHYVRLAQKLIWALQTRTADGACYQIDARLRPSGNQGLLVTSRASFAAYHTGSAQAWERQALLRARPVVGSPALADAFDTLRRDILLRPLPADAAAEIRRIRQRMEAELAQERGARRDFKIGRGGMLDVESVVQFLQLRHLAEHPELLAVDRIGAHIARLARLGLLAPDDAEVLRHGWAFLERLSSRLRIVENRSISDLDEERGDLDGIATHLGYTSPQRAGGARRALLEDYRRHTAMIRAVYDRVLG